MPKMLESIWSLKTRTWAAQIWLANVNLRWAGCSNQVNSTSQSCTRIKLLENSNGPPNLSNKHPSLQSPVLGTLKLSKLWNFRKRKPQVAWLWLACSTKMVVLIKLFLKLMEVSLMKVTWMKTRTLAVPKSDLNGKISFLLAFTVELLNQVF